MSISLPLDSTACAQADDVFYCVHADEPSVWDAAGNRVPLSADDPSQEALRDHWCDLYEDILAHNRDGSRPFPSCGHPAHLHHPANCPHCVSTQPVDPGDPGTDPVDTDPVDPVEGCPCQDPPPPTIRLRATLFFDGTGNNRANVESGGYGDSYEAGYTNVARLEWAGVVPAPELTEHITIYVEGVGTVTGGSDDWEGAATGWGAAGLKAKVARGIDELLIRIRSAASSGDPIEYIHLDAIGFSRGAASARHFVHQAMLDPATDIATRLRRDHYQVGEVKVKFVGLFDTVAAFGAVHSDDTWELSLDAIRIAERVVQLAAAEEHRANFSLTNIASAGNGTEVFLPGVHSDVGGGYANGDDEIDVQLFDVDAGTNPALIALAVAAVNREWAWLVDAGWYREDELRSGYAWDIYGTRRNLPDTYARIPLHLMAQYARAAGLAFNAQVERGHPIPADLREAQQQILAAVGAHRCGSPSAWFSDDPSSDPAWLRALRHSHLHFSSLYGMAASYGSMHPRFSISPFYGVRERRIMNG